MSELHVVLGAGQVGPRVAELLVARGHRVRVVRQRPLAVSVPGVEVVTLDVRDAEAVARATEGAKAVYHCVNPPYFSWPELLLPTTRGIVAGTAQSGADLVVLDNLYMYGDTAHMHPDAPVAPRSKKGKLRAEAAALVLDDAGAGRRVVIGRAADFFGPDATQSLFGERFFRRMWAGKPGESFGDPTMPHSYSYLPDVAAGLVDLGTSSDAKGIFMLPVQPAESTASLITRCYQAAGLPPRVAAVPTWSLRLLGLFDPSIRELVEMVYQWQQPFVVDDSRHRTTFGRAATPWDEAVAATVAWGRERFGA